MTYGVVLHFLCCVVLCCVDESPSTRYFVSRLSVLRTPFYLLSLVKVFFVRLTIRVVQFIWNPALQWRAKVRFKALCVKHFRFQNLFWIRYTTCDKVEMMRYGPCHLQLNLGLDGLLPFLRRLSYSHTLSNLVRITRTLLVVIYLLSHKGRIQGGTGFATPALENEKICIA